MNEKYMKMAFVESKKAYKKGEIPVGCVIVENDKVLAKAHNLKEIKNCSLCHAELLAIKKASKKKKNWRLIDCDIYITMEPCPMCASAIKQARIKRIFYGVENKNNKISKEILNTNDNNEKVAIVGNIMEDECKTIVQKFFENQRKN